MADQNPAQSKRRSAAVAAGVNAVQEEFDERNLGDATLIVEVILDESGLLADEPSVPFQETSTEVHFSSPVAELSAALHAARDAARNRTSAQARARAGRLQHKAFALSELERATAKVEAARKEQTAAMEYAAQVHCSLRQIGDAAGMSFSGVRSRLQRGEQE